MNRLSTKGRHRQPQGGGWYGRRSPEPAPAPGRRRGQRRSVRPEKTPTDRFRHVPVERFDDRQYTGRRSVDDAADLLMAIRMDEADVWNRTNELKASCDQDLHDLVGAAVDALHTRVTEHSRYGVFVHVAIAAMKLEAFIGDFELQIGRQVFHH